MQNDVELEFINFLSQYSLEDILSVLIQYQLANCMRDGEYLSLAEYATANALYACPPKGTSSINWTEYLNLEKYLKALRSSSINELFAEAIKRKDLSDNEKADFLQSSSMKMKSTFLKGDGYLYQLVNFARELYVPLDSLLQKSLGFSYSSCEKLIVYLFREMESRYRGAYKKTRKLTTLFNFLFRKTLLPMPSIDNGYIFRFYKKDLGSVVSPNELDSLLNYLSVHPFKDSFEKVGLSDFKRLTSKPFVDFGEYIYIPLPLSTLMNLPKLFHYTFVAESYFTESEKGAYTSNRGQVVENLTKEYFSRIIGSENIFTSLKYCHGSGEADVTICTDDATVFCECKSKILTLNSLGGNIDSIKDDVKKAIGNAFNQALRSIAYVEAGKEFQLNSSERIRLKNTISKYIVCVTAEHFGLVPSELSYYNLVDSKTHICPYVVNIFDLDIITQECSSLEEFLSYLDFRTRYTDLFTSFDELDVFGYYKNKCPIPEDANCVFPAGYSSKFDQKYGFRDYKFIKSLL